jgi:hypothetical protein
MSCKKYSLHLSTGGEVRQVQYKIGTNGHVVRLVVTSLIEARGLLVPGQVSTVGLWGLFAEDVRRVW